VSLEREAELKYLAADEQPLVELATAARLGPATLGGPATVDELDRYLDTADLRLAAMRWACRLRTRRSVTIVSLKGPAEHRRDDLVHVRPEVEGPAGVGLDPAAWPRSQARDWLIGMSGGRPLEERLRLEQQRTERDVEVGEARAGRLSLDRIRVLHGGREVGRFAVVELELDPDLLASGFDPAPLAEALGRMTGLEPDPASKLEHALAMLARA
jgi:inorganic triphosphatase YgiF